MAFLEAIPALIGGGGEAAAGGAEAGAGGGRLGQFLGGAKNTTSAGGPTAQQSGAVKIPEPVTEAAALAASTSVLAGIHGGHR